MGNGVGQLRTADGERLVATLLPGPGDARPGDARLDDTRPGDVRPDDARLDDVCVVLAHGFSGSSAKPALRRVAEGLAARAAVLAYDARGHGGSSGSTTLGDREVLDVDAAVAAARGLGFSRVVTCGWSMGGATVIRHAALRGEVVAGHRLENPPDAVVSVSATSRWFVRDTVAMRRLHRVVETRAGRVFARRVMATRVAAQAWDPLPVSPVECVARVAPLPLLLVHGDRDGYFPVEHPRALEAAAGEPTELWLLEGFGHAENAATPELLDRLGRHLPVLLARA